VGVEIRRDGQLGVAQPFGDDLAVDPGGEGETGIRVADVVTAIVADPTDPAVATRLNRLQPRGDDLLLAAVTLFAIVVVVRLGRSHHVLGIAAAITGLAHHTPTTRAREPLPGTLETVAPLCFLGLVTLMGAMSFRGL